MARGRPCLVGSFLVAVCCQDASLFSVIIIFLLTAQNRVFLLFFSCFLAMLWLQHWFYSRKLQETHTPGLYPYLFIHIHIFIYPYIYISFLSICRKLFSEHHKLSSRSHICHVFHFCPVHWGVGSSTTRFCFLWCHGSGIRAMKWLLRDLQSRSYAE